jgi:hypothetical protein
MSIGYLKKCSTGLRPKQQFADRAAAESFRISMVVRRMWRLQDTNTYPCNQCQKWHAGRMGSNNRGSGRGPTKPAKKFDTQ